MTSAAVIENDFFRLEFVLAVRDGVDFTSLYININDVCVCNIIFIAVPVYIDI